MSKLDVIDKVDALRSRMRYQAFIFQGLAEANSEDDFQKSFYENTWNELLVELETLEAISQGVKEL